jgi:prepilin signal peptidase PulO-like enzyme (type II secretory pathway)
VIFDVIILTILGLVSGVVINALADCLPYYPRQRPFRYANDVPRPLIAWSGILAVLAKRRRPAEFPQTPPLSWRYALTELSVIALFLLAYNARDTMPGAATNPFPLTLFYMALFVLITVIDIEHRLIQFVVVVPAIAIALIDAAVFPPPDLAEALRGALTGFGIFFVLYIGGFAFTYVMSALRGRQVGTVAFGFGDVMLITLSGALLGMGFVIVAVFVAVFLGAFGAAVYLILRLLLKGKYELFTAIPYGPYIVAATILMMLDGRGVWQLIFGYYPF